MHSTDTQSAEIASPTPSLATNHAQGAGVTAATLPHAGKELCNACGSDWQQAHFIAGRLLCEVCYAGRQPAVAMPPTKAQQLALDLWVRPGVSP
ncbi:MAG: hypothetical protein WCG85_02325 [Polyangia bacterium]